MSTDDLDPIPADKPAEVVPSAWEAISLVDVRASIPGVALLAGPTFVRSWWGARWFLASIPPGAAWALIEEGKTETHTGFVASTAPNDEAMRRADEWLAAMPNDVVLVTEYAKKQAKKYPRMECPLCGRDFLKADTFPNHQRGRGEPGTCDGTGKTPAEALEMRRTFRGEFGSGRVTLVERRGQELALTAQADAASVSARVTVGLPLDEVRRLHGELADWLAEVSPTGEPEN